MRHRFLVTLGLCAVAFASSASATWRATLSTHAVAATQSHTASVAPVAGKFTAASQQTRKASAAVVFPTVREIDLEGFKKILRRDPERARSLLVNFWATWCDPCREEFPDLVRIDADYKSRGLEFVTVSLDEVAEIKTGVPQFLQKMRATMPAYLLNVVEPETIIAAVDPAWGGGLPATFLFDARGQLVFKHMGRIKPMELRAAIEKVMSDER